jgi:hypothetical protein
LIYLESSAFLTRRGSFGLIMRFTCANFLVLLALPYGNVSF